MKPTKQQEQNQNNINNNETRTTNNNKTKNNNKIKNTTTTKQRTTTTSRIQQLTRFTSKPKFSGYKDITPQHPGILLEATGQLKTSHTTCHHQKHSPMGFFHSNYASFTKKRNLVMPYISLTNKKNSKESLTTIFCTVIIHLYISFNRKLWMSR